MSGVQSSSMNTRQVETHCISIFAPLLMSWLNWLIFFPFCLYFHSYGECRRCCRRSKSRCTPRRKPINPCMCHPPLPRCHFTAWPSCLGHCHLIRPLSAYWSSKHSAQSMLHVQVHFVSVCMSGFGVPLSVIKCSKKPQKQQPPCLESTSWYRRKEFVTKTNVL